MQNKLTTLPETIGNLSKLTKLIDLSLLFVDFISSYQGLACLSEKFPTSCVFCTLKKHLKLFRVRCKRVLFKPGENIIGEVTEVIFIYKIR